MKIGILKTGHPPAELQPLVGDYAAVFARLLDGHDFEFVSWNVMEQDYPDAITDADGWLITGSRHGAYENHPWIPPLEDFIREIYADGRPLVGVCFGHQIIAQALGGKVEKFEAGWSVGNTDYVIDGKTYALNAWHQDQVTALPKDATVVGASDFCAYAALAYGDRIWTIQPHPEYESDFISGLIDTRGKGVVPDPLLSAAKARLDVPNNNPDMGDHIAAFFKKERP